MKHNLKQCPFCHSEEVKLHSERHCAGHGDYYTEHYIKCEKCGAKGPSVNDYMSEPLINLCIEGWNKGR